MSADIRQHPPRERACKVSSQCVCSEAPRKDPTSKIVRPGTTHTNQPYAYFVSVPRPSVNEQDALTPAHNQNPRTGWKNTPCTVEFLTFLSGARWIGTATVGRSVNAVRHPMDITTTTTSL